MSRIHILQTKLCLWIECGIWDIYFYDLMEQVQIEVSRWWIGGHRLSLSADLINCWIYFMHKICSFRNVLCWSWATVDWLTDTTDMLNVCPSVPAGFFQWNSNEHYFDRQPRDICPFKWAQTEEFGRTATGHRTVTAHNTGNLLVIGCGTWCARVHVYIVCHCVDCQDYTLNSKPEQNR